MAQALRYAPSSREAALDPRHRLKLLFCLFAVYLIWGSAFLAIRIAVRDIPPLLMAGGRLLVAGSILYLWLAGHGESSPTVSQWISTAGIAMLMIVLAGGTLVVAEQWVDSGIAAVLLASAPVWTALFAGLLEGWPSRSETAGLLIGFVGVVLLNARGELRAHPFGAILLTVSAISWALGSVLSRRAAIPKGLMASASQMLAGGVMLTLLGILSGERIPDHASGASIAATAYLALFSSLIGYSAYTYLIHHTRVSVALSYGYINPVVAVILGVMFGDESVTALEIVAMVLTLVSVFFLLRNQESLPDDSFAEVPEPPG